MNKKLLILSLIAFFLCTSLFTLQAQLSFGKPEKLNEQWLFTLGDDAAFAMQIIDERGWQNVTLPHDWSVKSELSPSLAACTGYLPGGIGWYRKNLLVPAEQEGKRTFLYFEGVYNRSQIFINGQLIGARPNGYVSFYYDVTDYLIYGANNTIAVRVDHSRYADSRWYTGSGIYRNVWLITANPIHIAPWGVYAYASQVSTQSAQLYTNVEVKNTTAKAATLKVVNELFAPNGASVGKNTTTIKTLGNENATALGVIKIKKPLLWDLDNPHLYTLKTTVLEGNKIIDETTTTTGFRNFTFDPNNGFFLNGTQMKMKGVCLHHDAGVLGAAVPRDVWKRRLITLKDLGCNAIRTSHNPQAPDLYELCDELGLLVMNEAFDEWEFPKRKWIQGWNVGTPGFDGSYDFFEEWGERDLTDMIKRDRNHVSIFAWSIGNEVDYPNDPYSHPVLAGDGGFTQAMYGGYQPEAPDAMRLGGIAKRLAQVVKQNDPNRPVTAGLAGVAMSNETEYPSALDIAGYNYTEGLYAIDHTKYPNRVIYGSENRHDFKDWKVVRDTEYIFGQFLWTGIDYLGESGVWPSRGFYSGLLDFGGFIKPRGYFRKALWANEPTIYIGTYAAGRTRENRLSIDAWDVWNYQDAQNIRVVCYTNTPQARLELNGKVVGAEKQYDDETGVIFWDIPYQAGKLEAVGLNEQGVEQCRYAIQSSGRPYALQVLSVDTEIAKERGLAQVVLQVIDEEGIPVMLADNEVTCRLQGPVRLLGLEASNNSDMTSYNDNKHRVFHGRILAYIEATGEAGTATIQFTSPLLKSTEVKVNIK